MADSFQLEIVTPEKLVVKDSAEEAQIPATTGYIGVLPGHAPLITELGAGEISYRSGGRVHRFATAWGFAEIRRSAQRDLAKAEDELKSAQSEEEVSNDLGKVRRAQARIEVADASRS